MGVGFMYVYLLIPDVKEFKTSFFSIISISQESIRIVFYTLFSKIHLIVLTSLFFLTSSNWWRYFLYPIIYIGYFQLCGVLKDEAYLNANIYLMGALFTIIHFILLFFIDKKTSVFKTSFFNIVGVNLINEVLSINKNKVQNDYKVKVLKEDSISNINDSFSLRNELKKLEALIYTQPRLGDNIKLQNKKNRSNDFIISFFLISIPFLIFSFKLFETGLKKINFGIFEFNTYHNDIKFLIWLLSIKVALLILLTIWYVTSTHIWRYAILVHIIVVLFQVSNILSDNKMIDENEFLDAIPVIIPVLALIFCLGRWVKYKSRAAILNEMIMSRIDYIINALSANNLSHNDLFLKLKALQDSKNVIKAHVYYKELNKLKLEFRKQLDF